MGDSSQVGARFEQATVALFTRLFPLLGFEVLATDIRRSGTQKGFDILFVTRPRDAAAIRINFFIECKGAKAISALPLEEFEGKPDQLVNSRFNPDYWILFSPLRYLTNEFQENLSFWNRSAYPFALITWARESRDPDNAGLYLDLYKHFSDIYALFSDDVPENIRDTAPYFTLDDALKHLRMSLSNSYDEFRDRVVVKGLIPGVRRVTAQSAHKSRENDAGRLAKIRNGYYMLNSSDRFVWKVVCNDLDVRDHRLSDEIAKAVDGVKSPTESIWILGAPGCGKTTQMNRAAVDFAIAGYPVVLVNALELDETTRPLEYEEYLRKLFALHNSGVEIGAARPLLFFVDNPAARIETITRLLDRFDALEENFKCIFLLFEREVRYHQAEEESFLPDLIGGSAENIYIDNTDAKFKQAVFESFAEALDLTGNDRAIAKDAFDDSRLSIAEAVIDFCKRTNNDEYKRFAMDWIDFERVIRQLRLNSLIDLYKWISTLYQFGIALPISIIKKVSPGFNENEFLSFQEFFTSNEYENLPVIVERKILRARHELISQWHVEEKLAHTIHDRLLTLLTVIDTEDSLERSVFIFCFGLAPLAISLLGRKQIVRRFFAGLHQDQLKILQQKSSGHPMSQRIVMMMTGWNFIARREFSAARDIFKAVMTDHPRFLPPILEAAKAEFALRNEAEAERLLQGLLVLDHANLHARTELAKVHQVQKRYEEAEKVLKESLAIDSNQLHPRTELAKVYQAQKRYQEAEKILEESLALKPDDLQARTELAKIYQVQKRYGEAEKMLKECTDLSPQDLNSRTELAKVFQALKRYEEAEKVLRECTDLSPRDLNSRTELARVYQALNRYKEAEKVLNDLIGLDRNNVQARTELAKVYQVQKRYDEPEKILKESLVIDLNQLHPRTELAKVYQVQKRYEEAEKILEELLVLEPDDLQARTELAKVYQVQKRYEKAERVLKESLVIDPKQLHPRTELAKVYQVQNRYEEAENVLNDLIGLDRNNLQARTELAKVYQVQRRYDEAEKRLKEYLALDPKGLQPRTELARVYIKQGLFRKARTEVFDFLKEHEKVDAEHIAHLILAYLNACYLMRRYQDGPALVDAKGCQFVSPELAEEYGRLLRSYDLPGAAKFFRTAIRIFHHSSRLLSEAAVCFKLAGENDAEAILETAIELEPYRESKYRHFFDTAREARRIEFLAKDRSGIIRAIEEKTDLANRRVFEGVIESEDSSYHFWSNRYGDELFSQLNVNSEVFFDLSNRVSAINVEPTF